MFYKKIDLRSKKSMFEFLHNHFLYYTMNGWNNEKSIANNVKLYNLDLRGDWFEAYDILYNMDYLTINEKIEAWEDEHAGYKVGFNGRSGGYLVLYNENNYKNILNDDIFYYNSYEELKKDIIQDYGKEYAQNYLHNLDLKSYTKLVQDFDILCDDLRQEVQFLMDNYQLIDEEITIKKTIKVAKLKSEVSCDV